MSLKGALANLRGDSVIDYELGNGQSAISVQYLFESQGDSITAHSGGGQGSALQLAAELNRITTAAATSAPYDSIALPASKAGLTIFVTNHGSNPIQVFGVTPDTIDDVATATGVTQMANSMVLYVCHTAGAWYTEGLATGFVRGYSLLTQSVATVAANSTGTQGSGTAITAMTNAVSSAGSLYSVTLPPSSPGMQIAVHSVTAANTIAVFPNAGGTGTETINALSANAGLSFAALTSTTFYCTTAGQWYTLPRVPS